MNANSIKQLSLFHRYNSSMTSADFFDGRYRQDHHIIFRTVQSFSIDVMLTLHAYLDRARVVPIVVPYRQLNDQEYERIVANVNKRSVVSTDSSILQLEVDLKSLARSFLLKKSKPQRSIVIMSLSMWHDHVSCILNYR
jgi:hypothetical protein